MKHKNLESLKHYLDKPTLKDKENYAKWMFGYADSTCDNSDLDDFEDPQPPPRTKQREKNKPTATVSRPSNIQNQLAIPENNDEIDQNKENNSLTQNI